jgi:hypothetical protein
MVRTPVRAASLDETDGRVVRLHVMRSLAFVALVACGSGPAAEDRPVEPKPKPVMPMAAPRPTAPAVAAIPSCVEDGKPYDEKVMRERIAFLASKELDGRAPGTNGDTKARAYIVERFRCLGLVPAGPRESFELPFEAAGKKTANVVGYVKGTDDTVGSEIILVSSHHDHLGDGHLGANDNASGVVGVLSIAQAIQQRATKPKRTIVFAAFGGEEGGMLGSYQFAKDPPATVPLADIVQVINLDMVGSHASRKLVAAMGAFKGFVANKLLTKLAGGFPKINVSIGGRARGSDYEPFCKLGVPYVFFWTPDKDCYHEKCDTPDKLDYPHMVDIIELAGALTEQIGDTAIDLRAARKKLGCGVPY